MAWMGPFSTSAACSASTILSGADNHLGRF
jgi:hypothetical protein